MTKVKVILKKEYSTVGLVKHYIILNETTCSLVDCYGKAVVGKIIGVSLIKEETQLLIRGTRDCLYNRKLSDIQNINGKFEKIEEV